MAEPHETVTGLLHRWRSGSDAALPELLDRLYPELKRLARIHLRRERSGHTLVPTALVHEAYLKLVDQRAVDWEGRRHFLAVASRTMRRLLVDHARARGARKRSAEHVTLDEGAASVPAIDVDILDLVTALEKLEQSGYGFEAEVVQLRYLGGLSMEETAAQLSVGHATVGRAWAFARAWLLRELRAGA